MGDWGQYEDMEAFLNNKNDLKSKNTHLKPLYRHIRRTIRELTFTEEAKVLLDYQALRDKIEEYYVRQSN